MSNLPLPATEQTEPVVTRLSDSSSLPVRRWISAVLPFKQLSLKQLYDHKYQQDYENYGIIAAIDHVIRSKSWNIVQK
jgi:hypothetical protein